MTNANVQPTTVEAAQTGTTVTEIVHDQESRQYQKLYKLVGFFQYEDQDAGKNPFAWFTPLIGPNERHIDAATGETINDPSNIPVYMRGGMSIERFKEKYSTGIHTIYVLAGNIASRNDIVSDSEVKQWADTWYNGDLSAVQHLPLRQKPASERSHLSQDQLRKESAQDRFMARGAYTRVARSMDLGNQEILAAGMQENLFTRAGKGVRNVASRIGDLLN